jgi:outer membrane lipoprotein carrier protein
MLVKKLVILLVFFICPFLSFADSPALELSGILSQITGYSADFTQISQDGAGNEVQRSTGHLWINKPHKFKSHPDPPFEQVLVSDGKLLWFYDPDLEQVTIQKRDFVNQSQPAFLLAGQFDNIEKHFLVDHYADEEASYFVLRPVVADGQVVSLAIEIKQGIIASISVVDALNQKTELRFSAIETNPQLDSSIFLFDIPEGVDVVKEF